LRRQQSLHLFKWQIALGGGGDEQARPTIADCVAATLVVTIQRTGSSKSLILPIYELEGHSSDKRDDKDNVLQIWVLNSSIVYAASGRPPQSQAPARAIKLLYKYIPRAEADAILDNLNSDVQEINLPRETIGAVTELLERSTGLLPARDRLFKEWKIGLLERWDPGRHS
jgi:ubiquitin-protein ligase E3 D